MHSAHSDILSNCAKSEYKVKNRTFKQTSKKISGISKTRETKCYKVVMSKGNSPDLFSVLIPCLYTHLF